MFKHTLLDSVNIFCKAIALYFFTISIIFIQDSVFFMIVSFFFFALLHRHRYTGMMSLIATLIAIVAIFYPQLLWISKILILIVYVCLLTRFIHAPMIKYIFEKTLYNFSLSLSFTLCCATKSKSSVSLKLGSPHIVNFSSFMFPSIFLSDYFVFIS